MVTSEETIINANNNLAILANSNNKSYYQFIPEIYRDAHKVWVKEYIERIEAFGGKKIGNCFSTGTIEIKMVEMTHKVIPRFMNGFGNIHEN